MPDIIDVLLVVQRFLFVIRVALNRVYPVFNKVERKILFELSKSIKPEYSSIYKEHISSINLVQRDGGGKVVRMYCWKFPGYYSWKRSAYVSQEKGIVRALKFSLIFSDGEVVDGALVSIDGVLCNMTFGDSLDLYKFANLSEVKVKVKHSLIADRLPGD